MTLASRYGYWLTLMLVGLAAAACQRSPDLNAAIRQLVDPLLAQQLVTGMAIGVQHDGREFVVTVGTSGRGPGDAIDADTVFEIGSLTKPYTALAVTLLAGRREMLWEQPAQQFLPSGLALPSHQQGDITLRHLATHTAGLPRVPTNVAPQSWGDPYREYDLAALQQLLNGLTLSTIPGQHYTYSNLGYDLLGLALAQVTQQSYEAAMMRLGAITETQSPNFTLACEGEAVGLGWHRTAHGEWWQNGETGGFAAFMGFAPARGSGVVVLSNTASPLITMLGRRILQLLRGEVVTPLVLSTTMAVPDETLDRYVGLYQYQEEHAVRPFVVQRDGSVLSARVGDYPPFRLYPTAAHQFMDRTTWTTTTFLLDTAGRVTHAAAEDGTQYPRVE
ncbi:MAG: beta-lactamase family protein [Deltaproteobacteria bacterium]|nr:beta-lactamase family protein [Deltaproteobacteria bacterium]